jgi:hypothetical protein
MSGRVDSLTWKLPDDLSENEWIEAGIVLARIGAGVMVDRRLLDLRRKKLRSQGHCR